MHIYKRFFLTFLTLYIFITLIFTLTLCMSAMADEGSEYKNLYSADGRIRPTLLNEVDDYLKVGWFEQMPLIGTQIWVKSQNGWTVQTVERYNTYTVAALDNGEQQIEDLIYWVNGEAVNVKLADLLSGGENDEYYVRYLTQNPKNLYGLTDFAWSNIKNASYWNGMCEAEFELAAYFKPEKKYDNSYSWGKWEKLSYPNAYFFFDKGILKSFKLI